MEAGGVTIGWVAGAGVVGRPSISFVRLIGRRPAPSGVPGSGSQNPSPYCPSPAMHKSTYIHSYICIEHKTAFIVFVFIFPGLNKRLHKKMIRGTNLKRRTIQNKIRGVFI